MLIETIFDHNISLEEMSHCFGRMFTKEQYMARINQNQDAAYNHIAYLLHCRGQRRRAKRYIKKISDPNKRNPRWMTFSSCIRIRRDSPPFRQNTSLALASFLIRRINHDAGIWMKNE